MDEPVAPEAAEGTGAQRPPRAPARNASPSPDPAAAIPGAGTVKRGKGGGKSKQASKGKQSSPGLSAQLSEQSQQLLLLLLRSIVQPDAAAEVAGQLSRQQRKAVEEEASELRQRSTLQLVWMLDLSCETACR
jgi:hypothetical protein